MDKVLTGLTWFECLCYLDDICVFSNTFEEHLLRLDRVISRITEAGLKFNPDKCKLFQNRIKFLGYEVSGNGVEPDSEKVDAILSWPIPTNLTELRSWIGLISYYRRWIQGFSSKAKPLFNLMKKGVSFCWSHEQQESFDALKLCLTSSPILGLPLDEGKFVLDTDGSGFAVGAVLQQWQGPDLKVIAYASKVLRGSELNYNTTQKELTGVIFGLKQFRHYLLGRHFTLRTDHSALTYLMKTTDPVGKTARHLDYLGQFDFHIEHRAGRSHGNCDGLSRRPEGKDYPAALNREQSEAVRGVNAQHFATDAEAELLSVENIALEQRRDIPLSSSLLNSKRKELNRRHPKTWKFSPTKLTFFAISGTR